MHAWRERELCKALAVLKAAAQATQGGAEPTEEHQVALSQVLAMLSAVSEESLSRTVGPLPLMGEDGVYLDKAVEAVERAGIVIGEGAPRARLLLEVGEILYIQGSWDSALQRFEEALRISERVEYAEGKARALRQIGRLKRRRGDWEGAKDALSRALKVYRGLEDRSGEVEVLLNLGHIQFEQGDYEEAERVYREALELSEGLGSDGIVGDINLSLGVIRLVLGQGEEAITHFTESLARYEVSGDHRRMGQVYFNLAITYGKRREWERAGATYERALELARASGDLGLAGLIYLRRGEMQAKLSDAAMAMAYGQKALEVFDQLQDPLGRADVYKLYGRVAGLKRAWDRAEEFLGESERLHRQYGCRLGEAEVEEERGWLYELRGNRSRAMEAYRKALAQYQALRVEGSARHVQDVMLKLQEVPGA